MRGRLAFSLILYMRGNPRGLFEIVRGKFILKIQKLSHAEAMPSFGISCTTIRTIFYHSFDGQYEFKKKKTIFWFYQARTEYFVIFRQPFV